MKNKETWINITIWVFIVVFLVLGAYSIVDHGPHRTISPEGLWAYNNDDTKYIRAAATLLETGMLTYNYPDEPTVFIMPGIVFVLAPFVHYMGQEGTIWAFKIFQLILQALNLYLIFLIAQKVFGNKVGLLALAISATYVANFYAVNVVLTEVIFLTLFLALILSTLKAIEGPTKKAYAAAGWWWALAMLFRPSIALFPIVILIIWLVKRYTLTDITRYTFTVLGILVIVLAPWWTRNFVQFGQFIPLTLSSGNPMLQGTFMYGVYTPNPAEEALIDWSRFEAPNIEGLPREIASNTQELAMARFRMGELFRQQPWEYLRFYTIDKTIAQWRVPFVWYSMFGLDMEHIITQHLAIMAFFLIGLVMVLWDKHRSTYSLFLILTLLYFNVIHLLFLPFSRYMYPVMSIAIIFAAYCIIQVISKLKFQKF